MALLVELVECANMSSHGRGCPEDLSLPPSPVEERVLEPLCVMDSEIEPHVEFVELRSAVLAKDVSKLRLMLGLEDGGSRVSSCQEGLNEAKSSVNKRLLATLDAEGLTLMHQAIFTKSVPVLSALIEAGGVVNARDEEGCTLLHTAAMVGNCLIAGWLLKEGANPVATDAEGLLPIDRTEDCGMEDLLLSAMSLAGHVNRRANISLDLSEADDSDYATGSSSYGSFSEDDDGVLSLGSLAWQEEDDEAVQSDVTHGPFLTLRDIKPHSPERVSTRTAGEWTSQNSPTGDCRRSLAQVLESTVDHYAPEHGSYDSDPGTDQVPSFLTTLADGVRLWQQQTQQSPVGDHLVHFDIEVLSGPSVYLVKSAALPGVKSSISASLPDELDANCWSKIHREIIMTGFQVVTKSHAEFLQKLKRDARQSRNSESSSTPHGALSRCATVSESDLGWVMPRTKQHAPPSSILRHHSMNDDLSSFSQRRQAKPGKRRVTFPTHVVFKDSVTNGNVEEVQDLVLGGRIQVNSLLPTGHLPLHLAVSHRQRAIAQILLANRAEVDGRDLDGWTPLHTAADEGTVPLTNLLLEYHADPLACTDHGRTPLMLASNPNVRLVLQNASRDAMSRANKQRQARQETANLLENDNDDSASDEDSEDEMSDDEDVASCTVSLALPSIDQSLDDGSISDIEDFDECLVRFSGCDIDPVPNTNPTDEEKLAARSHSSLVSDEPQLHSAPETRETAVESDRIPGTLPATRSKVVHFSPKVLLRHAILSKDTVEVRGLLRDFDATELGLNQAELSGVTAIHQAVLEEADDILRLLLEDGRSDVNAKDADGWTPLHAAAAVGSRSISSVLLQHGAQATLLSDDGKFPIELAEDVELEGMLRQAMHSDS